MDVLLISNYWHFEHEKFSSRYLTIANMACDEKIDVEVVTSSFYHATKKQRNRDDKFDEYKFKTTLIYEPGYKKNIDLKRIISHYHFSKNVLKYLENRKKPDVIYLFVPPLGLAENIVEYANKNDIKVIIDVLDLWPEAFNMVLPLPKILSKLLFPLKCKANKVYANADGVVAVSDTYLQKVLNKSKKCNEGLSIYIGAEGEIFDEFAKKQIYEKPDDEIWIAYIGMLGTSYDLCCIMDAISLLEDDIKEKVVFQIMGDGPQRKDFEKYASEKGIKCIFSGKMPYDKMVKKLCLCNIAVNPIKSSSASSIINKVADYAAAGLPVINTQKSIEYRRLVDNYNIGFNTETSDPHEIKKYIEQLAIDEEMRKKMGDNNRILFEEKFDRKKSYYEIIEKIKACTK